MNKQECEMELKALRNAWRSLQRRVDLLEENSRHESGRAEWAATRDAQLQRSVDRLDASILTIVDNIRAIREAFPEKFY